MDARGWIKYSLKKNYQLFQTFAIDGTTPELCTDWSLTSFQGQSFGTSDFYI